MIRHMQTPHRKSRHDVGAVLREGDAAEPFGLALRAKHAPRSVQARQTRVCLWRDLNDRSNRVPAGRGFKEEG